jgi:hypothetical protein
MSDKKTCFVIMPITVPPHMREVYRDGEKHFTHVLDSIIGPAIEKAGYEVIPPSAKGADLIQAEIIGNLETSDLVLCDMSALNPNVFFEFGIRCALNKPICVVRDGFLKNIPFDPGILNCLEYTGELNAWETEGQVRVLSDHILESAKRCEGKNPLWKYIGFREEAKAFKSESASDDKLEYLAMQIEALRKAYEDKNKRDVIDAIFGGARDEIIAAVVKEGIPRSVKEFQIAYDHRSKIITIRYRGVFPPLERERLIMALRQVTIYEVQFITTDLFSEE